MDYLEFAKDVVDSAVKAGADQAEVHVQTGDNFSVNVRMGSVETLSQATSKGMSLRVFVDKRMASAGTSDFTPATVSDLVKTTVKLAKSASRDRFNGLPDLGPAELPKLDLFDPAAAEISAEDKISMAMEAEKAALDYDTRITNSYGGGFGSGSGTKVLTNSNGILYSSSGTSFSIWCSPLAEQDGEKQMASHWSSKRFLSKLDAPGDVGREAALRAVRKLGGRKVETCKAPIVFDWTEASTLWRTIFWALDGDKIHRGLSFLRNMLGKTIASPMVTLIDDPFLPEGLGSTTFDGEGVPTKPKSVVENGVLRHYFYTAYTGRKYGAEPSGNSGRGSSISPTNFYLKPTDTGFLDIIRGINSGFLVTETMGGQGINSVTGDFSVGASGIWIRDGELAFPVQGVTIAGNMLDMMRNVEAIANDLRFNSSIASPTFKISEMTVSGR